MNDSEVIMHLSQVLTPYIQSKYPGLRFVQKYQPTAQGTPSEASLFIFKVSDNRFGFARSDYAFKLAPGESMGELMPADTVSIVQSRFQISALKPYIPNDPTPESASDMLRYVANLMSVDGILMTLHRRGLHLMRIREVVNPPFEDDADMFAMEPSFDVTIQHHDTIAIPVPRIVEADPEIHAV